MNVVDLIFPEEQSDAEMGAAYEEGGSIGLYKLMKRRATEESKAGGLILTDATLRDRIAASFGVSAGDLSEGVAEMVYWFGQTA